jgi:hypothetical protein
MPKRQISKEKSISKPAIFLFFPMQVNKFNELQVKSIWIGFTPGPLI